MTKQQILSNLISVGVVPVVRTATAEAAIRSIEALFEGGITVAEITMTVPGAIKALEAIAAKFGDRITLVAPFENEPAIRVVCNSRRYRCGVRTNPNWRASGLNRTGIYDYRIKIEIFTVKWSTGDYQYPVLRRSTVLLPSGPVSWVREPPGNMRMN